MLLLLRRAVASMVATPLVLVLEDEAAAGVLIFLLTNIFCIWDIVMGLG